MNEKCTKMNKWRDEAGNVYTVEQSARNKRFMVIRTNPEGNREAAKVVSLFRSAAHVQKALDEYAKMCGWTEVTL